MNVHLKNKYIGSKSQARDSCYNIIINKVQALIWLYNITCIYTIWHNDHYRKLFWHVFDHIPLGNNP